MNAVDTAYFLPALLRGSAGVRQLWMSIRKFFRLIAFDNAVTFQ